MAKKVKKGEKTLQELKKEAKDLKNLVADMRLEKSQNKLKNLRSIFMKRKEIARLLTQIRELELSPKIVKEVKK
jgi:ribosomal protein L29